MSANKPKPQQEEKRKPIRNEDDFDQGRTPAQRSEQGYGQGQEKNKDKYKKGGQFEDR